MEIEPKRLIIGLVLVFLLGISFAVVNGYYFTKAGQTLPLIVYAMSFLSVLVGASLVLLFQWRISRLQLDKILGVLEHDERTVIRILLDNKGHVEQNYIVAMSGMNKVAVSRVIAKLEQRGVVEKLPLGNTNMVVLKL